MHLQKLSMVRHAHCMIGKEPGLADWRCAVFQNSAVSDVGRGRVGDGDGVMEDVFLGSGVEGDREGNG